MLRCEILRQARPDIFGEATMRSSASRRLKLSACRVSAQREPKDSIIIIAGQPARRKHDTTCRGARNASGY
jgi:hypothetical protein